LELSYRKYQVSLTDKLPENDETTILKELCKGFQSPTQDEDMAVEVPDTIKKETYRCPHDFTYLATAPSGNWKLNSYLCKYNFLLP
jgi:hypothetical protein